MKNKYKNFDEVADIISVTCQKLVVGGIIILIIANIIR